MVFSSQPAACAGAKDAKAIASTAATNRTQPKTRMTGLPQLKWQVYHSFFRPQPDSYTALRFRGLVTPVAALHPFARESGWRAASRGTPAAPGAWLGFTIAARRRP